MTTSRITVSSLLDHPLTDVVQEAGAKALAEQGWFARRKNTVVAAAQVILQVLNLLAFTLTDVHWGVTLAVAVVVGVGEVIIHAATRGPVTPSGVDALSRKAAEVTPVDPPHMVAPQSGLPHFDRRD